MSASASNTQPEGTTPQTRYRKITACLRCRDRKKKCDRKLPVCINCEKEKKECVYANDSQQLKEHKQKLHNLNRSFASRLANGDRAQENPELNPLIVTDPAYEEDADDDSADLGIKCGKLRISDRIGGFVRPKAVEEITYILVLSDAKNPGLPAASTTFDPAYSRRDLSPAEFMAPGPSYLAPASGIFWPSKTGGGPIGILPDHTQANVLLHQYWTCVHPIARLLHKPTFQRKWDEFWSPGFNQQEAPKSFVALINSVLFSSVVSMHDEMVSRVMNADAKLCIEAMQSSAEAALGRANWIRSTKVETLQALVVYLIPLCRAEVSRAHSNIVATAIRAAEGMGLHMDGTSRDFPPLETHIRRLIWYQLSLLDIRTCEATGPRPQMRSSDFETQLPFNIDDEDLQRTPMDKDSWTEMTVTIIRMKCNEFIRQIWIDRRLLQSKQITVTEVLLKIETFYQEMDRKYGTMVSEDQPIQKYGAHVYKIQILRTFAMVLHQYHLHPKVDMSDRLKHVFIVKGIETMETIMAFETDPELACWQWLSGALQQHHYALAMLMELCMNPQRKDAPRLLRCLDYVFEPPDLPPLERVRMIVRIIRDRMKVYVEARKVRAPVSFMQQLKIGRQESEPSESGSSVGRHATPEGSSHSTASGQLSDTHLDMAHGLSINPGSSRSSMVSSQAGSQSGPAGGPHVSHRPAPQITGKDIMDVNWDSVAQFYPDISAELDMSNEQFNSALNTGAYPPQISQYNQMPVSSGLNQSYNYYSSYTTAEGPNPQHYNAPAYASQTPSTFQPMGNFQAVQNQYPGAEASAFLAAGAPSNLNSAAPPHNSQSAAGGFPQGSDSRQNFGIGLYRAVNMETR